MTQTSNKQIKVIVVRQALHISDLDSMPRVNVKQHDIKFKMTNFSIKVTVKVTMPFTYKSWVSFERASVVEYAYQIKSLYLSLFKLKVVQQTHCDTSFNLHRNFI